MTGYFYQGQALLRTERGRASIGQGRALVICRAAVYIVKKVTIQMHVCVPALVLPHSGVVAATKKKA